MSFHFRPLNILFAGFVSCFLLFASIGPALAQDGEENQAWNVRCNETEGGQKQCEMFQQLVVKDSGERFAEFAIGFPEDKDTARGVVILPLGILLPPGVMLQIDDGSKYKFDVRYCVKQGCLAFVDLSDKILDELRMGGEAILTAASAQGKPVKIRMSLMGFTKAYNQVKNQ